MNTKYIFIFGVSRSGTSLMRKILNNSDQIAICNENHFLGHLIPYAGSRHKFRRFGDLKNDDNVRRLVDYIYSGEYKRSEERYRILSYHWRWIMQYVDRDDFERRILATDRSERSLFVVMMQVFADHMGRPIMGEKTPAHFRYVSTLVDWFPDGKIIHMIRDPRGIFMSELRTRRAEPITPPFKQLKNFGFLFTLFVMLQTTVFWLNSVTLGFKYKKLYPDKYYPLKFEDLVADPETEIKNLCEFLGVEFQEPMLDQVVVSKGFQLGKSGFDKKAASRWKEQISPWIERWFVFWFGKYLRQLGYAD